RWGRRTWARRLKTARPKASWTSRAMFRNGSRTRSFRRFIPIAGLAKIRFQSLPTALLTSIESSAGGLGRTRLRAGRARGGVGSKQPPDNFSVSVAPRAQSDEGVSALRESALSADSLITKENENEE